jgi:hypothetical protein
VTDDQLDAALQAEYLHLQRTIEDFDGRALFIKAWSVSFGLVAVVGAFASRAPSVFLVASLSACLFWLLETVWKTFQLAYYERSQEIEKHFRGEGQLEHPFQIGASWYRNWSKLAPAEVKRVGLWVHVALPRVFVSLVGVVLYVLAVIGAVTL